MRATLAVGLFVTLLYVMFARQSFGDDPIDWSGIALSSCKIMAFFALIGLAVSAITRRV